MNYYNLIHTIFIRITWQKIYQPTEQTARKYSQDRVQKPPEGCFISKGWWGGGRKIIQNWGEEGWAGDNENSELGGRGKPEVGGGVVW